MNKEKLLKKLGKHIKEIRKSKNMSQAELGYLIDKDQQSIQRLESGNINPSFIYLCEISKGLEISVSELIKDLE